MAASTNTQPRINDTDANFRLWVAAIIAGLAQGLTQTSDTGQINTATVLKPAGASTSQGYAIFRSSDASGSLHNWYLKIEFGSAGAATSPAIWLTIGWGSDGAGNLTGNTTTRTQINPSSSSGTVTSCNFAAGTGYCCVGMWDGAAGVGMMFSIERTRTIAGAIEDQVFIYAAGGSTLLPLINQVCPYSGTVPASDTSNGAGWRPIQSTNATYGGNKGLGTLAPQKGGWLMESLNLFLGNTTDFSVSQVQYSVTAYGASHNYITFSSGTAFGGVSTSKVLLRYE